MKSTIHISADALRGNFAAIERAAGPAYDILCVLKADAYGHGLRLCAPVLVEAGAHWLGVGDVEEGVAARGALAEAGLGDRATRVLVMCGFESGDAAALVEHRLTPVVWTVAQVEALERAAAGRRVAVHVEVDTGMGRQGVRPGEGLRELLRRAQASAAVRCEGMFSHLCESEVAGSAVTAAQERGFAEALRRDEAAGPEYLHLGNTSATDEGSPLRWLAAEAGGRRLLARTGLALYGYTLPLVGEAAPRLGEALRPAARWTARVLDVRALRPGETVGYGATFAATTPMRVALLPVGYADGFRREASSGVGDGWVMVGGRRAPVLGRVSMNLTVVDVTAHDPAPRVGEEAVLLGPGVTAEDHARWAGTIPYEILCGMRGHRRLG